MKKKQVIAGAMSMFLLGAAILPVYAEEQKDMGVTYQQASTWEVSIPAAVLSQTEEVSREVTATAINIRPDETLKVTVKAPNSEGKVTLKRSDGQTTTTSVVSTAPNSASPITKDTVIAAFEDQSTTPISGTGTGTLYFSAVPADTKAGDYTGSITYIMEAVKE